MRRLLCALLALPLAAQSPPTALPADLDAFVARVQQTFAVPGLALAVVHDGQTLLAKGYGVRTLGQPTTVDAGTRFGIASNTKVFTAAALGILVDEGRLAWDAPVQRTLPWFHLADPFVSRELTVRDLLVHRSGLGLGAGDLLWWPPSRYSRREIAERLRHVPLATSFRSTYAYDNVLYLVAAELIERITGRSYEQFVTERLLRPAGMPQSHMLGQPAPDDNVATPHAEVDGTVRAVEPFVSSNTNPAGGIMASAADMAAWMQVLLARGALPDGKRVFSERTGRELGQIVTPLPVPERDRNLGDLKPRFSGYALGLGVRDYRGELVWTHTGGLPGYVSRVFLLPERRLGVTVLTNQESTHAFSALSYHIVDHLLGKADRDWLQVFGDASRRQREDAAAAAAKAAAARRQDSTPSLSLGGYAGRYRDAWYGDVLLEVVDGALRMTCEPTPLLRGQLEHWQHDTFVVRWDDRSLRADAFVTFWLSAEGAVEQVRMVPASAEVDFSFDFQDLVLKPVR